MCRRSGKRSIAITRSAPSMYALRIANWPTGPQASPPVRNLPGADVVERHAHVLRLPALVAAVEMRVAEEPRARVPVELLEHRGVRVRVVAERPQLALAEEAVAARDRERHDHAIAALQGRRPRADLDHLAHELVPEDVAGLHRGNEAAEEMEVGAADRGARHAHDRVVRVEDRGIRHALDAHVFRAVPADGLHDSPLGCPSVVGTSPASISCLRRRRSSCTCWLGSSPKSLAITAANFPPGGAYVSDTRMVVPRPPGLGSNCTVPACRMSASSSERHAMSSFGFSSTISASHVTWRPAGAFATQCERRGPSLVPDSRCRMKRGRFSKSRQNA